MLCVWKWQLHVHVHVFKLISETYLFTAQVVMKQSGLPVSLLQEKSKVNTE